MKCVREHRFKVELKDGDRMLVVVSVSDGACEVGQTFPVPEGEEFND